MFFVFFFFKQKTAYEMRISDWSSDVCSSDLPQSLGIQPEAGRAWAQQNARRLYHYPTIGEEYFPVQLTVVLAQRPGTDSDLHDRVRHERRAHTRAIPERGPVGHRCIWRRSGRSALLQDQPGAPEPVSSRHPDRKSTRLNSSH